MNNIPIILYLFQFDQIIKAFKVLRYVVTVCRSNISFLSFSVKSPPLREQKDFLSGCGFSLLFCWNPSGSEVIKYQGTLQLGAVCQIDVYIHLVLFLKATGNHTCSITWRLKVYIVMNIFRSTGQHLILLQKALQVESNFKLADSVILEPAWVLCSVIGLLHRKRTTFCF